MVKGSGWPACAGEPESFLFGPERKTKMNLLQATLAGIQPVPAERIARPPGAASVLVADDPALDQVDHVLGNIAGMVGDALQVAGDG